MSNNRTPKDISTGEKSSILKPKTKIELKLATETIESPYRKLGSEKIGINTLNQTYVNLAFLRRTNGCNRKECLTFS